MIKIGIDYSLISPAVTILKDDGYKFISFFDDYGKDWKTGKSKKFRYHRELSNFMEVIPYTRLINQDNYRTEQITKMRAAKTISELIVQKLIEEIGDEKDVTIGLEGFSYGSISSSVLDLAMYNSFLRFKLIETFGEENLIIISPTEGKKSLYGKGNANKDEMIESFISNRLCDEKLVETNLWKYCSENELDFKNIKPIDDLVDSYAILKTI